MAPTSTVATNNQAISTQAQPLLPPEEQFWHRYSPRHEFPLSSTSALMIHVLLAAAVFVYALYLGTKADPEAPLSVDVVSVDEGGGSGGVGGDGGDPSPREDIGDNNPKPTPEKSPSEALKVPIETDPKLPITQIDDGNVALDTASTFDQIVADARAKASSGRPATKAGTGAAGLGSGGGTGKGIGKGKGDGRGDRKATMSGRAQAWDLQFDTRDGNLLRREIAHFGAFLAVPQPNGEYVVIRDLNQRPAVGKVENPAELKRFPVVNSEVESVRPLSFALGLADVPQFVVVMFPIEFQDKLSRLERNYRHLRPDQIKLTRFKIVPHGKSYDVKVVQQNLH